MRTLSSIVVVVFSLVAVTPSLHAQSSHAAPQSALDATVQDHSLTAAADRDAVLRLLERADVQAVAGDLGLDLRRAQSAIATLDGQQLADLAAQARQTEEALAGGQSLFVISTKVIIIAAIIAALLLILVYASMGAY